MNWKFVKVGKVLKQYRIEHWVQNDKIYKQVSILNDGSVVLRGEKIGKEIGRKRQFVINLDKYPSTLIFTRQLLLQGSIGMASQEVNGCIATENMPMFSVEGIKSEFLFFFIKSELFKAQVRNLKTSGTAQKSLHETQFLELEIPLPSDVEQNAIIEKCKLSETNFAEIIKEIVNQQTYLQLLHQAILQEAVQGELTKQDPTEEPATELLKRIKAEKEKLIKAGKLKKEKELPPITKDEIPFELPEGWVWCRLGEIVLKSEAGKSLVCDKRPAEINEWGIIKVSAMSWGKFDEQENKVLPKGVRPFVEYKINKGDYLISRANTEELIGKSVIVSELQSNLLLSDKSIRIKFSVFVDNHYINFYNNSLIAREYYKRVASGTSDSMKNITREQMYLLPLPLPRLKEQHRIVAKVKQFQQQLSQLETHVQQNQQYAEQLLQSALKEAFEEKGKVFEMKEETAKLVVEKDN